MAGCLLSLAVILLATLSANGQVIDSLLNHSLNGATFDYVVVGCGIAGLAIAHRLSEDHKTTVLCLEAGDIDHDEDLIRIPFYIGLQPPLFYEWGHNTVPQTQLDGKTRPVPMGRGVGGGSLINGLLWTRGGQSTFMLWELLGNANWSWTDLLPYFKKSESFTPQTYPGNTIIDYNQVDTFNMTVHGFNGNPQVSYPNFLWPQTSLCFEALEDLGVTKCLDPNDGTDGGGGFVPLSIDRNGQTRSDARRSYYNPAALRPNFNLAVHGPGTAAAQLGRGPLRHKRGRAARYPKQGHRHRISLQRHGRHAPARAGRRSRFEFDRIRHEEFACRGQQRLSRHPRRTSTGCGVCSGGECGGSRQGKAG